MRKREEVKAIWNAFPPGCDQAQDERKNRSPYLQSVHASHSFKFNRCKLFQRRRGDLDVGRNYYQQNVLEPSTQCGMPFSCPRTQYTVMINYNNHVGLDR